MQIQVNQILAWTVAEVCGEENTCPWLQGVDFNIRHYLEVQGGLLIDPGWEPGGENVALRHLVTDTWQLLPNGTCGSHCLCLAESVTATSRPLKTLRKCILSWQRPPLQFCQSIHHRLVEDQLILKGGVPFMKEQQQACLVEDQMHLSPHDDWLHFDTDQQPSPRFAQS